MLRFGNYELIERLGVGGMAETFVAIRRGPEGFEQLRCVDPAIAIAACRRSHGTPSNDAVGTRCAGPASRPLLSSKS
jgi:hypothetical protein